jgi:hypothetical protein
MRMLRYLKDQLPSNKFREATRHYFVRILCVTVLTRSHALF